MVGVLNVLQLACMPLTAVQLFSGNNILDESWLVNLHQTTQVRAAFTPALPPLAGAVAATVGDLVFVTGGKDKSDTFNQAAYMVNACMYATHKTHCTRF
jgi:hypothetical protein